MAGAGANHHRRLVVVGLCAALLAVAWWATQRVEERQIVVESHPVGIMGTSCSIIAVLPGDEGHRGAEALQSAEDELRRLEGLFSTWMEASEISGLNRASASRAVPLSREALEVLQRARELHRATFGAFDITAGPLIDGWRRAAEQGRLPDRAELEALRDSSSWEDLELTPSGAIKSRPTLRLDVDGIAKGYAIDRAVSALRRAGAAGGMVEVGGDLRVFGRSPAGAGWPVGIRDPSSDQLAGTINIVDRAVCTSGGYARFVEIEGERYSHILDPRTGVPVDDVVSTTVIASDAATADAWATALSVLGSEGLESLEEDVEALLLFGKRDAPRAVASSGFPALGDRSGVPVSRID
ncbi:MAG: FAD:protein FMN transferase [bacterium]|nr:FAD:protein FMN transferase [bacterium]